MEDNKVIDIRGLQTTDIDLNKGDIFKSMYGTFLIYEDFYERVAILELKSYKEWSSYTDIDELIKYHATLDWIDDVSDETIDLVMGERLNKINN